MKSRSSIVLALGLVLASVVLSMGIYHSRKSVRKVTVKGLAEREVRADKAWWSINSQLAGNDVKKLQSDIDKSIYEIKEFLKNNNISDREYKIDEISVFPNNYQNRVSAFTANIKVSVTTSEIDKIDLAKENIGKLLSKGILITGDKYSSGPKYFYNKFTDIKPELLAEATKEAKKAAEEFAKNSGSHVGEIARANQGIVRILPANRTNEDAQFFKDKVIRVVTTVDYILN